VADLRGRGLRLAVGLAMVIIGIVEIQTLAQGVRAGARFRARVVAGIEDRLRGERRRLADLLLPGGWQAARGAVDEALRVTQASEVELFDGAGSRILGRPVGAPVVHWPTPAELQRLRAGELLSIGPVRGAETRLLTYAGFPWGDSPVYLRLSSAVPDLVEDLRERRQLLIAHGVAIAVLLVAGALALLPGAPERVASTFSALVAYEAAMERLREQGQELSELHAAERRRMEDQIRDKEAMARAGELTAGIVHELRNGLATILGYARLLEHDAREESQETARRIRQECAVLEAIIRRFMEFVKRETLQLAPFDLIRLLGRVAARESHGRPGAQVEAPTGEPVTIVADEELLERAFENVVRNAREAAGPEGHVWVDVAQDEAEVRVAVADDGPGLTPSVAESLRPFFTTKKGGLGLGLPIALKIVALHNGQLEFADRAPHGLRITVRLPKAGPPV
jgi:signal transduction histidine kinase